MVERHKFLLKTFADNPQINYELPFQILNFSNIAMNDQSFINIILSFDKIHTLNQKFLQVEDYEDLMTLDISRNALTESSLRSLALLLQDFNAIETILMS
jgi:hypothetical protein